MSTSDLSIFSDDHGKGFSGIPRSPPSRQPPRDASSPVMVMSGSSHGSSRHMMPEPPSALLPLSEEAPSELPPAFPADSRTQAYQTRHNSITLRTKATRKYDSSTNPADLHGSMYADHNGSMFARPRPSAGNSLSSHSLMQHKTSQREFMVQRPGSRARLSLDSAFPSSDPAPVSQHEVGYLSSGHQAPLLVRKGPMQAGNSLKGATAVFGPPSKTTEGRGVRPNTTTGFGVVPGGQQRPGSRSSDDIWNSKPFGRRTRQSRPVPSLH